MWERANHFLFGSSFRTITTLFAALFLLHMLYFAIIPNLLLKYKTHSPRLRRYLEWVVATPSLLGDYFKVDARHHLMRLAISEGRYEQAETQGMAILHHKKIPAVFAAEVRARLADALDGLGRRDEAKAQRDQADSQMAGAPKNANWYVTQGRKLAAEHKYAAACQAFEKGLCIAEPGQVRNLLTLHLCNTLFMAGRLEDSAHWAEKALTLVEDRQLRYTTHIQAGASYADLGRLDESEKHKRQALAIAQELKDPKRVADTLGGLAGLLRKRGRLTEAFAACDEAAAVLRATRTIEMNRYEILRSWGRFDEALAVINRASQLDPVGSPHGERRSQAIFDYAKALLLMFLNRLDEASRSLAHAREKLEGDAKLTLWCDAAGARLAALQGHRDEALQDLQRVESQLEKFPQDFNSHSSVLASLGRAALALGEYSQALHLWTRYLALPPHPVDMPTAYYYLGESHRGLGNLAEAHAAYRQAVDTGLDTHYAQLAQARLRTVLS